MSASVSADRAEPIDEPHSLNIQTIFFEPDPQRKMYKKIPINGQHEVIGMSGDIALYQGNPVVHTHIVVGNPDGTTRAGHVLAAYASPTLEVIVTVDPVAMQKRFDPATDLTLIDPALK